MIVITFHQGALLFREQVGVGGGMPRSVSRPSGLRCQAVFFERGGEARDEVIAKL